MSNHSRSPTAPPSSSSRRVERSCVICHRRKVRCDKQSPCSPCARGGISCFYPQAGPAVRRVRKTTMTDVASRITELEKTLVAVSRDHEIHVRGVPPGVVTPASRTQTHTPPFHEEVPMSENGDKGRNWNEQEVLLKKGSTSTYFNEALLSRVIEQEHDVRSVLSTPKSHSSPTPPSSSPFNAMGILSSKRHDDPLTNYLPSKATATSLWTAYADCVDPSSKVLHIPTDEVTVYTAIDDPSKASTETLALCFSIYYAGTLALDASDVLGLGKAELYETLHRYKHGLEQALAHSEFLESPTVVLLQALTIYMVALRVHNTGRGIWTLNGLAIRAAQSIGLHRDGRVLNLSPFESEIRRRLWWRLLSLDGRAAEDYGLQNISDHNLIVGVDLPLNVEDADLYPGMKQLPPPRVGFTKMTLVLANIEVARAWSRLLHAGSPSGATREQFRAGVIRETREKLADMLAGCNTVVPPQRMAARISRFILRKLDLVSRQRDAMNYPGNDDDEDKAQQNLAAREYFLEAVSVLEDADAMWSDELLRPYRWSMHAYRQFQMMLYIVWYLCVRPHDPETDRALAVVQSHLDKGRGTDDGAAPMESKWMVIVALQAKAEAIVEAAKKADGDGGAPVTPQDADEGLGLVLWKSADGNGEGDPHGPQGLLDWRTLLEDFQFDPSNLSIV